MKTPTIFVSTAITTPTTTNIPTTMMNGIVQVLIIEVLRSRAIFCSSKATHSGRWQASAF
jgi:hypothetical protein